MAIDDQDCRLYPSNVITGSFGSTTITYCPKCGKIKEYIPPFPDDNTTAPWPHYGEWCVCPQETPDWKYCPHCGKEIR